MGKTLLKHKEFISLRRDGGPSTCAAQTASRPCASPTTNDQDIPANRVKGRVNSFKPQISECLIRDETGPFSSLPRTIKKWGSSVLCWVQYAHS
ncbi:hypothetical protein ACFX11_034577 [Malus domestica]